MTEPALRRELDALRAQLTDSLQALDAFRRGEVDAVVREPSAPPLLLQEAEQVAQRASAEGVIVSQGLRRLADVCHAFSSATNEYPRLLELVACEVAGAMEATCVVSLLSDDALSLDCVAAHSKDPELLVRVRAIASHYVVADHAGVRQTLAGRAFADPPIASGKRTNNGLSTFELAGLFDRLWLPLRLRGVPIGILALVRPADEGRHFQEADRDMAQTLADHASLAIDNARSYAAERSARDLAEDATRSLREALVESAADAMVVSRGDGEIVFVNAQFEKVFGYGRSEIIGQAVERLMPERYRSTHGPKRTGYLGDATARPMGSGLELVGRRKDGSEFPIEVSLGPLDLGQGILVSSTIRDITSRKRVQDALTLATDTALAASRELETFTYSVAHDLRSPLRGMSAFAELLLETYGNELDGRAQEWLGNILLSATRMATLIDALLDLSRLAKDELHCEPVDLSAAARAILGRLITAAPDPPTEVVIQQGLGASMDPALALVLLENLLGNAFKFTRKVAAPRIELGAVGGSGARTFFVRDNGAGFDMAHAEKLFVPLQRLHAADEFPGTGIGLATAQRVVRRHGGQIWAEGAVDGGATVSFTLPTSAERTPS
jgi:PAS domain S-box-containing protein